MKVIKLNRFYWRISDGSARRGTIQIDMEYEVSERSFLFAVRTRNTTFDKWPRQWRTATVEERAFAKGAALTSDELAACAAASLLFPRRLN